MFIFKTLKDKIQECKDELQKLSIRDGENKNEMNKLNLANEKLKAENEALRNKQSDQFLKNNEILEKRIQNLNDNLHLVEEENIRLKNENERLDKELTISRPHLENREEFQRLCCSISTLQELRFQNEGKIKVRSFGIKFSDFHKFHLYLGFE